jgi:hypothetical protein
MRTTCCYELLHKIVSRYANGVPFSSGYDYDCVVAVASGVNATVFSSAIATEPDAGDIDPVGEETVRTRTGRAGNPWLSIPEEGPVLGPA